MAENETPRSDDTFEVTELDDKSLEDVAGGNAVDGSDAEFAGGNTNCGCGGVPFSGGDNNGNCGCA